MPDERTQQARGDVSSNPEETKRVASDLAQSAKDGARGAAEGATEEASRRAHAAKDGVADEMSSVASALRTAADELRRGSPQERTFGQIAESLADASESLREKDLGEMAGDLSAFARRNPVAFLGGALMIGFAASRFGRASRRTDPSRQHDHPEREMPRDRFAAAASPRSAPLDNPERSTS